MDLNFKDLKKQGIIECWYNIESIEVVMTIEKSKITSTVDHKNFYYSFIDLLETLNIDVFRLVLYAKHGEEFNKILSLVEIKDKVKIVEKDNKELLNIENISKLFKN